MNDLQCLTLGGELHYTFDFTLEVPNGVTITGISYVVPSGLTQFADDPDLNAYQGTIGLRAGQHGGTYQVLAKATLSNGEVVPQYLTVRVFNG